MLTVPSRDGADMRFRQDVQALALHAAQCTEPNGFVFGYVYYVYGTPGGRAEGGGRRGSAESQSPEGGAPSAEGPTTLEHVLRLF